MMRFVFALSVSGLLALMSGCVMGHNAATGAGIGTGLGALTGAVIGSQTGHEGGGAVIGAVTGALAGGLIGDAEDAREERDAAIAQSQYEHAVQQANAQAMTNSDLVFMAQSGVSDEVIKTAVNTRGGRFELSPVAIVQLKNSGVSDRVILNLQQSQAIQPVVVPARQIYPPGPFTEVVVIPPPHPTIGVGFEFGPSHFPPRHHW